tara:strand:+ start:360 stop:1235 length:876 start_codon:yes stop_codon:yes gene_type:complete
MIHPILNTEYKSLPLEQRAWKNNQQFELQNGIGSIKDLFIQLSHFAGMPRFWLRGESKQYEDENGLITSCMSTFSRSHKPETASLHKEPIKIDNIDIALSCITNEEIQIIDEFKKNHPNDEFFIKMVDLNTDNVGWLSYAQHYGISTRLVDITENPLVALYFACNQHQQNDGWIFMYTTQFESMEYENYKEMFNGALGDQSALEYYKNGKINEYKPNGFRPVIKFPVLIKIPQPNDRVLRQKGAFIWSAEPFRPLLEGTIVLKIKAESKGAILSELKRFGIDKEGLGLKNN